MRRRGTRKQVHLTLAVRRRDTLPVWLVGVASKRPPPVPNFALSFFASECFQIVSFLFSVRLRCNDYRYSPLHSSSWRLR